MLMLCSMNMGMEAVIVLFVAAALIMRTAIAMLVKINQLLRKDVSSNEEIKSTIKG